MNTEPDYPRDGRDWRTYRRLLAYVRPYWLLFLLALAGYAMGGAAEAYFVRLFGALVDNWETRTFAFASSLPLVIIATALIRGMGEIIGEMLLSRVSFGVVHTLRTALFEQLLRMPSAWFDASSQGHLVSRLTYNVGQLRDTGTDALKTVLQDGGKVLIYFGSMLWISWKLTLIFAAVAPVVGLIVIHASRRFRRLSRRIQSSMGDVTHVTAETVTGYRVVRIFGGESYERERFESASATNQQQNLRMVATKVTSTHVIQVFVAAALALLVFLLLKPGLADDLSTGQVVTLLGLAAMLARPIRKLTEVNARLQRGLAAADDIFAQLDQPAEADTGTLEVERVTGRIEFRGVSFAYAGDGPRVLQDINLVIEPGQTVALVGRSGGGKSTLASLIPRFYEPLAGSILLDDVPLSEYRLSALRRQIGLVNQQVTLFNDTLARNVAYGALGVASPAAVADALRRAHADAFVRDLPQGLETVVGDDGVLLSGGQRQRIAIARALLKDAPILILDEATSALDNESERQIQAALEEVMRGRTTLVVAHRLSTVERADRIIVMAEGRIAETGTHAELLARGGAYAALYEAQFNDTTPTPPRVESPVAAIAQRPRTHGAPLRSVLERRLLAAWYQDAWWLYLLRPLERIFRFIVRRRRAAILSGRRPVWRAPCPVIIVGNLAVGGTGKTPFVMWLVEALRSLGHRPGIVSRGYGGQRSTPQAVTPGSDPRLVGDEPVLLATRTGAPVWIGADRVAAVQGLLAANDCSVVVADDGLQHLPLGRDIELVVIDAERGLGNRRCLPAGPLREPVSRLEAIDWVILNGACAGSDRVDGFHRPLSLPATVPVSTMRLAPVAFVDLVTGARLDPADFCARYRSVRAVAAIGHPERFFNTLNALGLSVEPAAYPDHHEFRGLGDLLPAGEGGVVVCTEKDAVKVIRLAGLKEAKAGQLWVLVTAVEVDPGAAAVLSHLLARQGIRSPGNRLTQASPQPEPNASESSE
ncbi:MAG: lipid A export permease/ATP-binding protein MsbA [Pseudomonadales bacterium]